MLRPASACNAQQSRQTCLRSTAQRNTDSVLSLWLSPYGYISSFHSKPPTSNTSLHPQPTRQCARPPPSDPRPSASAYRRCQHTGARHRLAPAAPHIPPTQAPRQRAGHARAPATALPATVGRPPPPPTFLPHSARGPRTAREPGAEARPELAYLAYVCQRVLVCWGRRQRHGPGELPVMARVSWLDAVAGVALGRRGLHSLLLVVRFVLTVRAPCGRGWCVCHVLRSALSLLAAARPRLSSPSGCVAGRSAAGCANEAETATPRGPLPGATRARSCGGARSPAAGTARARPLEQPPAFPRPVPRLPSRLSPKHAVGLAKYSPKPPPS